MKLSIVVCATKSYTYAMKALARRVASCLKLVNVEKTNVFIVGDTSVELKAIHKYWVETLPTCDVSLLANEQFVEGKSANYKQAAQLLIGDMRSVAHTAARNADADFCWSLDSDTLPQPNALRVMLDACNFDGGFYSVAMCPYPNGAFLGGFGTLQHQIAEDFLPSERKIPAKLSKVWKENERRLGGKVFPCFTLMQGHPCEFRHIYWKDAKEADRNDPRVDKVMQKEVRRRDRLHKKIKECPPDGNIWEVTAKHGWRRRGWLDNAYPGIGHGAIVPTDWVGFGCTLMNKNALALAHFEGYEGHGTEDLFIGWHRWHPAGLKMAVIPHCPADHVIDSKKKGDKESVYTLCQTYHEQQGECRGHLRVKQVPWRDV